MRSIAWALFGLALTAGIAVAEGTMMTIDQMKAEIIGNSLSGKTEGDDAFVEHYKPDGTIIGLSKGAKYQGTWRFRADGLMCFKYGDGPFDGGCVHLSRDGDQIAFTRVDGSTEPTATLMPGMAPELK